MTQPAEATSLLFALEQLLAQERSAIARLDGPGISAVASEKMILVEQIRSLSSDDADPPLRRQLAEGLGRLLPVARANAALIADAGDTLAAVLGVQRVQSTYDGRARLRHGLRASAARQF